MTRDEADNTADWATLDGEEAFALIACHANDFDDANELMQAWARTRVSAEREACAKVCDTMSSSDFLPHQCAAAIRARGET